MPERTVHCSICGKAITGYDLEERMSKLWHHRKHAHPTAFKRSVEKSIRSRRKNK